MKIYDHLLQFPLFQGLSRNELLQMAGNTKFGFMKEPAGSAIVSDGELCTQLFFLIDGYLTVTTGSDDHSYSVTERLSAPWMLQPEALFGLSPRYSCTATADTATQFITLSKEEVLRLTDNFLIVRLNLLNIMATLAQRRTRMAWHRSSSDLRGRIAQFITNHCTYPAGPKTVNILMQRLAQEMNDSRLDVSRALNAMKNDGIITLRRGHIEVPSIERLFM